MSKYPMPSNSGVYWCKRSSKDYDFTYIAKVTGIPPMLQVQSVFDTQTGKLIPQVQRTWLWGPEIPIAAHEPVIVPEPEPCKCEKYNFELPDKEFKEQMKPIHGLASRLTKAQLERLAMLGEEMSEAGQMIGKVLKHGYESYHPEHPNTTNRIDLEKELGHVLFVMLEMMLTGDIDNEHVVHGVQDKQVRSKDGLYTHYQRYSKKK